MMIKPRAADDPRNSPVFLRKELNAAGIDDRAIGRRVRAGDLAKVRFGAYVAGEDWRLLDTPGRYGLFVRAAVRQAKTDVVVSHVSCVNEYEAPLWGLDLTSAHLTRLDGRAGRKAAGVHQHCGDIQDGDVVSLNGLEMMSATRAALEVTCVASLESSLIVVNHLLHAELTTAELLAARNDSMLRWPGTLNTDLVLRLADKRIETIAETRTFLMCWRAHLPKPVPQFSIRNDLGDELARLDFAWPDQRVWLEFDGKEKYLKHRRQGESVADAVTREKEREQMIAERTGWRCIRITWADLETPRATTERISRLLGLRAAA